MAWKKEINRRQFLHGVRNTTLALPVLSSFLPSLTFGQSQAVPKRVILIQARDGTFESEFWPKIDPTNVLDAANGVYGHSLSSISGPISNILTSEWDPIRAKVSLIRGLGFLHYAFHKTCGPYSAAKSMSGAGEKAPPEVGSSIDCILENSSRFMTQPLSLAPIRIGHRNFSYWRPLGGDSAVQTIPYMKDDKAVFDYVFPTTTQPNKSEPLIMDQVLSQFNKLMGNRKLSSADKQRLEKHRDDIHDLQKKINQGNPTCIKPNLNFGGNKKQDIENYMDTIVGAFSCDLSRLATVFINNFDDEGSIGSSMHHDNSHGAASNPTTLKNCRDWQGWMMNKVAYLMKKLDAVTLEDGKTLLDHTIVVYANEDGNGRTHSSEGLQLIVGGGGNGALKMGDYIDYRARPFRYPDGNTSRHALGLPWPGALISIMKAAGLTEADYLHQGAGGLFGQTKYDFDSKFYTKSSALHYRKNPLPYFYQGS